MFFLYAQWKWNPSMGNYDLFRTNPFDNHTKRPTIFFIQNLFYYSETIEIIEVQLRHTIFPIRQMQTIYIYISTYSRGLVRTNPIENHAMSKKSAFIFEISPNFHYITYVSICFVNTIYHWQILWFAENEIKPYQKYSHLLCHLASLYNGTRPFIKVRPYL